MASHKQEIETIPMFPETSASPTPPTKRKDNLTFKANTLRGRHGWLRLTPAYSVQVVEELLASSRCEGVVLDPFCGSGTTALVCAERGIACHTVDINPFLVWLASAKCGVYTPNDISLAASAMHEALSSAKASSSPTWTPPLADIGKWWDPETLQRLSRMWEHFRSTSVTEAARNLLKVIFCRVAIECAHVSFGHQSMSFKTKTNRLNAARLIEPPPTPIEALFNPITNLVFSSAQEPLSSADSQAFQGDARRLPDTLPSNRYGLVITSPPYPNRMSYIRELRPYMYWLGYLTTGRQAGELDWKAIGGTWGSATSNLSSWTKDPSLTVPHAFFEETVALISARSKVLGTYVAKYFEDVVCHVRSLRCILASGAPVHYVVGNSKFYDVMLETEQIYAAVFASEGFTDVNVKAIRKRTSKKELFEFVVSAIAP